MVAARFILSSVLFSNLHCSVNGQFNAGFGTQINPAVPVQQVAWGGQFVQQPMQQLMQQQMPMQQNQPAQAMQVPLQPAQAPQAQLMQIMPMQEIQPARGQVQLQQIQALAVAPASEELVRPPVTGFLSSFKPPATIVNLNALSVDGNCPCRGEPSFVQAEGPVSAPKVQSQEVFPAMAPMGASQAVPSSGLMGAMPAAVYSAASGAIPGTGALATAEMSGVSPTMVSAAAPGNMPGMIPYATPGEMPAAMSGAMPAVTSASPATPPGVPLATMAGTPPAFPSVQDCQVSQVKVQEEHSGNIANGLSLADISATFGGTFGLTAEQRSMVIPGRVADLSFQCLDDRVTEPSLGTPGGDLGEFVLALSSYLTERDGSSESKPTQDVVNVLLKKYLETIPASRPFVHCTDDRAVAHLEGELPAENLDLAAPPEQAKQAGLLQQLTEVENHGDSHIRLMLKNPEWFQLRKYLVPMVLKAYYSLLWEQNQNPQSELYHSGKLRLNVLAGQSNPKAFVEVSSGHFCNTVGVAPQLTPRSQKFSLLVSHLDAVSIRREELATFFSRIANATPRKIDKERLHQRLDRHGWLALETTGSRIAEGLPFFSLDYA